MHYYSKNGIIHGMVYIEYKMQRGKKKKKIQCEAECGSLSVLYIVASLSALFNPLTHVSEWIILLTPIGHLPKNKHLHLFLLNILNSEKIKNML